MNKNKYLNQQERKFARNLIELIEGNLRKYCYDVIISNNLDWTDIKIIPLKVKERAESCWQTSFNYPKELDKLKGTDTISAKNKPEFTLDIFMTYCMFDAFEKIVCTDNGNNYKYFFDETKFSIERFREIFEILKKSRNALSHLNDFNYNQLKKLLETAKELILNMKCNSINIIIEINNFLKENVYFTTCCQMNHFFNKVSSTNILNIKFDSIYFDIYSKEKKSIYKRMNKNNNFYINLYGNSNLVLNYFTKTLLYDIYTKGIGNYTSIIYIDNIYRLKSDKIFLELNKEENLQTKTTYNNIDQLLRCSRKTLIVLYKLTQNKYEPKFMNNYLEKYKNIDIIEITDNAIVNDNIQHLQINNFQKEQYKKYLNSRYLKSYTPLHIKSTKNNSSIIELDLCNIKTDNKYIIEYINNLDYFQKSVLYYFKTDIVREYDEDYEFFKLCFNQVYQNNKDSLNYLDTWLNELLEMSVLIKCLKEDTSSYGLIFNPLIREYVERLEKPIDKLL